MGGLGSGRQGWLPVVEDGLKLDIRRLQKQGILQNGCQVSRGSFTWRHSKTGEQIAQIGYSCDTSMNFPWIDLKYTIANFDGEDEHVDERFALERFPQPFGGHPWYIQCPSSGRRCQCLYKPAGARHFRSRQVHQLQYRSQCQCPSSRMTGQMQRLKQKVLSEGPRDWQKQHADWDFPPKPPQMKWVTYNRYYDRWCELEEAVDLALAQKLGDIYKLSRASRKR